MQRTLLARLTLIDVLAAKQSGNVSNNTAATAALTSGGAVVGAGGVGGGDGDRRGDGVGDGALVSATKTKVNDWTPKMVADWLKENALQHLTDKYEVCRNVSYKIYVHLCFYNMLSHHLSYLMVTYFMTSP